MAYNQVDHLQKVALDGFAIIDEHFGRGSSQGQYHRNRNHQKRAPNQYCSGDEPVDEPSFRNYRPPGTRQVYETWYFLPVPQAPMQQGAMIDSRQAAENYGGKLYKDHGYKARTYLWGYK